MLLTPRYPAVAMDHADSPGRSTDQLPVERDGLLRDGPPARTAGSARSRPAAPMRAARSGSVTSSVNAAASAVLVARRDQQPGRAVGHHFRDSADRAGDHRGPAGHGLEVDDAQRLVHRRADEDGRAGLSSWMTSGRGSICSIQTTSPAPARPARPPARSTSAASSGVSGAPAHSTSCTPAGSVRAARSRCGSPFCRVIRPTKMTYGRPDRRRAGAARRCRVRRVLVGVDAVVDHPHPLRVDLRVRREHVLRASRR